MITSPAPTPTDSSRTLTHGTGGTCWPTSIALAALLEDFGFTIRRIVAAMNYERLGHIRPGHASLVATVDGRDWLVDTSMLSISPCELRRGETTVRDDAVHAMRADPHGAMWIVRWSAAPPVQGAAGGATVPCMFLEEGVPAERFAASYEATRSDHGPFNSMLVARRNLADGSVISIRGGTLNRLDASGMTTDPVGSSREQLLVQDFGFSTEIVGRLPPYDPPQTEP